MKSITQVPIGHDPSQCSGLGSRGKKYRERDSISIIDLPKVPKSHSVKYPQKASSSHQTVLFQLFINGFPSMCLIIVVNNSYTTLFQIKSS